MRSLLLIVALFGSHYASACVCTGPANIDEAYDASAHVAVIEIVSAKTGKDGQVVSTGRLVEVLKGKPAKTIRIWGFVPDSDCFGGGLDVGGFYVVFLSDPAVGSDTPCNSPESARSWLGESRIAQWKAKRASN